MKGPERNFEREDELNQPSTNDDIARGLVEANVKMKMVPIKFRYPLNLIHFKLYLIIILARWNGHSPCVEMPKKVQN